jgi:hypothetical protein
MRSVALPMATPARTVSKYPEALTVIGAAMSLFRSL